MQIYIPSMQRADDQRTLAAIRATGRNPCLVIPRREARDYAGAHDRVVLTDAKGIANTRQFIMDYHVREFPTDPHMVMMDDDLSFHVRRMDDPTKFTPARPRDVSAMLNTIDRCLRKFAHVGVLAREGGNRIVEPYVDCSRPLRVYAYNMVQVAQSGARYTPGLVQDDFDMTLQLLRKGLANRIICSHVNDQVTSNAPGGASTYRTIAVHNASVQKLAKLHAPHVRVVEKETKGAWQGQPRLDVIIAWKQAFKEGQQCALQI